MNNVVEIRLGATAMAEVDPYYGELSDELLARAEETLDCLEDCWIGFEVGDRVNAIRYIAAMMRDAGQVR